MKSLYINDNIHRSREEVRLSLHTPGKFSLNRLIYVKNVYTPF